MALSACHVLGAKNRNDVPLTWADLGGDMVLVPQLGPGILRASSKVYSLRIDRYIRPNLL